MTTYQDKIIEKDLKEAFNKIKERCMRPNDLFKTLELRRLFLEDINEIIGDKLQ